MTMTGAEGLVVSEWATVTLATDATLSGLLGLAGGEPTANRIWEGVAPDGIKAPYIVFTVVEPVDVGGVGMARFMVRAGLTIRVVTQSPSYAQALPIAKRMDALLHGRLGVPTSLGGTVLSCRRLNAVQYPERANGLEYRHLGGSYEVIVQ